MWALYSCKAKGQTLYSSDSLRQGSDFRQRSDRGPTVRQSDSPTELRQCPTVPTDASQQAYILLNMNRPLITLWRCKEIKLLRLRVGTRQMPPL
jgi:hypothetical protein